jgi:predicted deacylase
MSDVQLRMLTLGGNTPGSHLLITGGVHGDEFEPPLAIRHLAQRPELADIRGKLTLVPVVNEAAFARASRVAEDGLDLARTCPGRADGTITQRTAHALTGLIREADYYVDLHTGGAALCVWPLAGYMLHARRELLDQQRAMARAFNLPVVWGTDANLEGRSLSVARDANVPAIYAEYEGGGRCSPQGVDAYVEGCLNVMAELRIIERPAPQSRVRFFVEDPRPHSGHMQRCYPAPASGCFQPAVELGQPITSGQSLGCVIDPLTGEEHRVLAEQSGRVLVLRTFPAVQTGDSLAVILEFESAHSLKGHS